MIRVTRLNGKEFYVNSDLIEFIESTPDTVVTLTTGKKLVLAESIDELVERIIKYRAKITILPNLEKTYRDEV